MKLKRGQTAGNVITIERSKTIFEKMNYTELLVERQFLRQEISRTKRAISSVAKCDPRGMFAELHEVHKVLKDVIDCCEFVINECQNEMIKRNK